MKEMSCEDKFLSSLGHSMVKDEFSFEDNTWRFLN